jgi:hypothetical protein
MALVVLKGHERPRRAERPRAGQLAGIAEVA